MAMTEQVRDAIRAMKEAGFRRQDFSCRVSGNGRTGYGEAEIVCYIHPEIVRSRTRKILEAGLGVREIILHDGYRCIPTISAAYDDRGRYIVTDYRREYGEIERTEVYIPPAGDPFTAEGVA